jgi:hypothetical protein
MTWFPFPNVPVVAQAYLLKALLIAVLVTGALGAGGGFWAGKEWAEGRAAQREVKTLAAEIGRGNQALGEYRSAIADGTSRMSSATRALQLSAITYAEGRDDALTQFNAAATDLQSRLDRRLDLAGCVFGPDVLRDINAARAGRPAVGAAGVAQPATGPGSRAPAAVPRTPAARERPRDDDGSARHP